MHSYNNVKQQDSRNGSLEREPEMEMEQYTDSFESEGRISAPASENSFDTMQEKMVQRLRWKSCTRRIKLAIGALAIVLFLGLYTMFWAIEKRHVSEAAWDNWNPYDGSIPELVGETSGEEGRIDIDVNKEKAWMATLLEHDIDGPYQPQHLRELCLEKSWREGLIISCQEAKGGIGNVRSIALNCFRYAVEAGASGIILPGITIRSPSTLSVLNDGHYTDYSFFFDADYIKKIFRQDCPQLKVYDSIDDLSNFPSMEHAIELVANKFATTGAALADLTMQVPRRWRTAFDTWLQLKVVHHRFRPSSAHPLHVRILQPLFAFPYSYDSVAFADSMGRLFRFRADIRRHSALVMKMISDRYNLNLDPAAGIESGKYLGVHLRTSLDAVDAGWPSWKNQSAWYLAQAHARNLTLMYVASGDKAGVKKLKDVAAEKSITVVTKEDFLTKEYLNGHGLDDSNGVKMTWDQLALIDYDILLRASSFAGISDSSFSWNVALRRNVAGRGVGWVGGKGAWFAGKEPRNRKIIDDDYSTIYGDSAGREIFSSAMWP